MVSSKKEYIEQINLIDSEQRTCDPMWGYTPYEMIEEKYRSLKADVSIDANLSESDKSDLLVMIDEKIKNMPKVVEEIREYEKNLHASETIAAKERYNKLSILKKLRLKLTKKDPKNINFDSLDVLDVSNLYKKRR